MLNAKAYLRRSVDSPSAARSAATEQGEPAQVGVSSAAIATTTATALHAPLPFKHALSVAGYQRTVDFGEAWPDENHNGCD